MERINILAIFLFAGILYCAASQPLYGQAELQRISVTERSDGLGFVIRNHLTVTPDSFRVAQPAPDLIQLMIYSPGIRTVGFIEPEQRTGIRNFEYHRNAAGFGIDIFLEDGQYFKTSGYPDRNGKDLLLALERIPQNEILALSEKHDFIYWYDYQDTQMDMAIDFRFGPEDDTFLKMRNGNGFNTVVLDAGHGGHDPGAINRSLGLREKDIALSVTKKVGEYLNQHMPELNVVYTRDNDRFIELAERGRIATDANGDIFISIHVNSARNTQAHGAEIYFLGLARSASALEVMKRENSVINLENGGGPTQLSEEELLIYELANAGNIAISERIAVMMESQFRNRAQRRSRGVKQAGFMVLWNLPMPALLVELGFITNTNEARYMASDYGQTILASAIFRAIRDFKEEYDRSSNRQSSNSRASNE